QGQATVGSMVVFQDAVPKKAHYRKFGVRGLDGQDDYAALAEVISRRFARMRDATAEDYDESFAAVPNLVVIDGGKGQLAATLPGVGPVRRRALLRHFGSAERFLAASQEELEGVPGMPAKTARAIYAQLHKAGRA